jgi:hypothetical protein
MGFENVDIQHTLKLTDIFCFFFKIYLLIWAYVEYNNTQFGAHFWFLW